TLLNTDVCTLIEAAPDVYQIRFKNRAANAYLVRGSSRTILIDIGLSSNFAHLQQCLDHVGCALDQIDMLVLSHEHLDHVGAADPLMPGGVMGGVFGSGSISDYIQSLQRLKGLNSKILLSGHGRLSDTPQDDVRIAIQRSHALLSDTAQLFDALDARSNFEPIMQSVRDLNKLDDS